MVGKNTLCMVNLVNKGKISNVRLHLSTLINKEKETKRNKYNNISKLKKTNEILYRKKNNLRSIKKC